MATLAVSWVLHGNSSDCGGIGAGDFGGHFGEQFEVAGAAGAVGVDGQRPLVALGRTRAELVHALTISRIRVVFFSHLDRLSVCPISNWRLSLNSQAFGRALGRPSGFQADIVQNFTYPNSSSQNVYPRFEHFYSFVGLQI